MPSGNQSPDKEAFGFDVGTGYLADLLRVPVPYVLELWEREGKTDTLKMSLCLPNTPESIQLSRPAATSINWTLGEPVREFSKLRHRKIQFRGRTGVELRPGYNRKGQVLGQPGPIILQEFDGFLKDYQDAANNASQAHHGHSRHWSNPKEIIMVFRAFDEQIHLCVEPVEWSFQRDTSISKFGYQWNLVLDAWGVFKAKKAPSALGENIGGFMDAFQKGIDVATAFTAQISNIVENFHNDLISLRAPFISLTNGIGLASKAFQTIGSTAKADFLHGICADLINSSRLCITAVGDMAEVVDAYQEGGQWEQLYDTFQNITGLTEDIQRNALEFSGQMGFPSHTARDKALEAFGKPLPSLSFLGGPKDLSKAGVYVSKEGETPSDIVGKFGQDKTKVPALAEFNSWVDSYHDSQGKPLGPGSIIYIPAEWVAEAPQMLKQLKQAPELFFTDLYLDPATGDLATFGTDKKDVQTVRGTANIEQAIRNRLLTTQGESAMFPAYGLPFKPGDPVTAQISATYVASHLSHQLMRDIRVNDVTEIVVTLDGDTVYASMAIEPTAGAKIPVISPVATGT
jgi:phage baseplate assembly protein W